MMYNKKFLIQSISSVIAIIGIAYGRLISIPDAVSKIYGIPLNWSIHQLVTIAGPVDVWNVKITYLVYDLIFWLVILLVSPTIVERMFGNQ